MLQGWRQAGSHRATQGDNAALCSLQGEWGWDSDAHSRSIAEGSLYPHHKGSQDSKQMM